MRQKAERLLAAKLAGTAHAQDCTNYGDRIEIRKLWACRTDPESIGLYSAVQVFVVEREVIPKASTVQASKELCYAISSAVADPDAAVARLSRQRSRRTRCVQKHGTDTRRRIIPPFHPNPACSRNPSRPVSRPFASRSFACFSIIPEKGTPVLRPRGKNNDA